MLFHGSEDRFNRASFEKQTPTRFRIDVCGEFAAAREQIEATVSKMAPLEGVTERLKADNQVEGLSA